MRNDFGLALIVSERNQRVRSQANLDKVRTFYEPWGDPRGLDFREWWKDHGYLFGGTQVEEITKVSKAPNVLNLSIPLNLAVTKTLPEIKALIEAKQRERLEQLGLDPKGVKSLTAGFGTYEINAKELRGRPFHEAHVIYVSGWKWGSRRSIPTSYKWLGTGCEAVQGQSGCRVSSYEKLRLTEKETPASPKSKFGKCGGQSRHS